MKKSASLVVLALSAAVCFAGTPMMDKQIIETDMPAEVFQSGEFQVDIFGTALVPTKDEPDCVLGGGGLGLNYFLTRCFGLGVETYLLGGDGFQQGANGNLILRYPIDSARMAPYIIGSGGGYFDHDDNRASGQGGVGAGIEYRPTDTLGVFVDARYFWAGNDTEYVLPRLGVRLVY